MYQHVILYVHTQDVIYTYSYRIKQTSKIYVNCYQTIGIMEAKIIPRNLFWHLQAAPQILGIFIEIVRHFISKHIYAQLSDFTAFCNCH